jgi:hypothetical protein
MGDLNNIMHASEKLGPRPANDRTISKLCCLVKDRGFFLLWIQQTAYTWTNKRFSTTSTYEHLDRFLANSEWCSLFSNQVP